MTIWNQIHNRLNLIAKQKQSILSHKGTSTQIYIEYELQRAQNGRQEMDTEILNQQLQKDVPDKTLKSTYTQLSNILTNINRTNEAHVTTSEHVFHSTFKRYNRRVRRITA